MRQQSKQLNRGPVGQVNRATLTKYLLKKGELENSPPEKAPQIKRKNCFL
jgi:hypothetical protein